MLNTGSPEIQRLADSIDQDNIDELTVRVYLIMHEPGLTHEDRKVAIQHLVDFARCERS